MRVRLNVSGVIIQSTNYELSRFESMCCIVVLLRVNELFAIREMRRDDVDVSMN